MLAYGHEFIIIYSYSTRVASIISWTNQISDIRYELVLLVV